MYVVRSATAAASVQRLVCGCTSGQPLCLRVQACTLKYAEALRFAAVIAGSTGWAIHAAVMFWLSN
jgi:hypothetical protein